MNILSIDINPEFEEMVEKKYREMLKNKISKDCLNTEHFGELKIFINNKPKLILYSTKIDSDKIYVGGGSM